MLSQVELGQSVPSINVVWKAAQGLKVPFSALVGECTASSHRILRAAQAKQNWSPGGGCVSRALCPSEFPRSVEFYELTLSPRTIEHVEAHQSGTRENLVVASGHLEISIAEECHFLGPGDAIVFEADVAHAYENKSDAPCRIYLVMTYERDLT